MIRFIVLLALLLPASAATAAEWGSPEVVFTGSAGNVHVELDGAGDGVVAFESPYAQEAPARIWVADVPAGGAPAAAVPLSADGERAILRRLVVAPDGRAAIAWEQGS